MLTVQNLKKTMSVSDVMKLNRIKKIKKKTTKNYDQHKMNRHSNLSVCKMHHEVDRRCE